MSITSRKMNEIVRYVFQLKIIKFQQYYILCNFPVRLLIFGSFHKRLNVLSKNFCVSACGKYKSIIIYHKLYERSKLEGSVQKIN